MAHLRWLKDLVSTFLGHLLMVDRYLEMKLSEQERAKRVTAREGITLEEAISANKARLLVDNERYEKMYGLIPDDPTPYTHIIDATNITAEQVLAEAIRILGDE